MLEKKGRNIHTKYFDDIDAVGYKYGIFVPREQPINNHFLIVKIGDYDGRLFIIDKRGNIDDFPGGRFFITDDKRYLVTEHSSDSDDTLTVIKLSDGAKYFLVELQRCIWQWYRNDGKYFYTLASSKDATKRWHEISDTVCLLDFKNRCLYQSPSLLANDKNSVKVQYYFDFNDLKDCECER